MNRQYFLTVFGEPKPPDFNFVQSGVYPAAKGCQPFDVARHDILLLYCTDSFGDPFRKKSPGIGVVLEADRKIIYYSPMIFEQPIPLEKIKEHFEREDAEKMRSLDLPQNWIFEINRQSFMRTVADQKIAWGQL
jgi:hypothetical protein